MQFSLQVAVFVAAVFPTLISAIPNSITPRNSPDNSCGGVRGFRCSSRNDGPCCSQHGWCGSTSAYCGTGCQSAFGTCNGSGNPSTPPPAQVETDFKCGPNNSNKRCRTGYCCSTNGWCGTTPDYCASGKCLSSFGVCTGTPAPPTQPTIETDFTCGPQNHNKTCRSGYCCSQHGYCGTTQDYCGNGCQTPFGICGNQPQPETPVDPPVANPTTTTTSTTTTEVLPVPEDPTPTTTIIIGGEEPPAEEPTPTTTTTTTEELPPPEQPTSTPTLPNEPVCDAFVAGDDCGEDYFCCPGFVCNDALVCDIMGPFPTPM